jgi:hypothetical protein
LVALVWGLETRPHAEKDFELYWRGLAALGIEVPAELLAKFGAAPPPRMDAKEISEGLAPRLDAVVSAIAERLDAVVSALTGKLDTVASSLRGKLDATSSTTASKLDGLEEKAKDAGHQLDRTAAKIGALELDLQKVKARQDTTNARIDDLSRSVLASGSLIGLGFLTLAIVQCQHARSSTTAPPAPPVAAPAPASPPPPIQVVVNIGKDVAEAAVQVQLDHWLKGGGRPFSEKGMGKRKTGRPMPRTPLPDQAVKPCEGSEETLYGSCWFQTNKTAPCPPDQFQEGDKCYVPSMDDPKKPVSENQQPPTPEPR